MVLFAVLAGCVIESHSAVATDASLQGVVLEDAVGNRLEASEATIDQAGNGWGRDVHAHLTVDGDSAPDEEGAPEPELTIDAERSDWNLKDKVVLFEGNVRASRGIVNLECQTLRVTLGASGEIESAIAGGQVFVQQGERQASSDDALLNAISGELVLTGNPVVREDGRSMRGERITLWLDDDRMTCDHCTVVLDKPGIQRNE